MKNNILGSLILVSVLVTASTAQATDDVIYLKPGETIRALVYNAATNRYSNTPTTIERTATDTKDYIYMKNDDLFFAATKGLGNCMVVESSYIANNGVRHDVWEYKLNAQAAYSHDTDTSSADFSTAAYEARRNLIANLVRADLKAGACF